ncbi:hypothetical protein [Tenacibaculum ovolyticum]|uniref:hypothetical protein n=1 Tax=Tenacibaculum ovolyticum TaxID=104270 RepID=UPI0007ECCC6F|nr:hypothetical protein [Tenacibaculum ovolyticum]
MILVLTTEAGDFSHTKFIDWLKYYKADFEILTGESIYRGDNKITVKEGEVFLNGRNYTNDVNVVFNRRWLTVDELPEISNDKILNHDIKRTLSSELYQLRGYLESNLTNAIWIPKIYNLNVNKVVILDKAKKNGLKVPNYIVTNNKFELITFFKKYDSIITKAIGNFPKNYSEDNLLINPIYTKIVTEELIDNLPSSFFLSIFQEYIPKVKEYRVMYFEGDCYTVEILSQENNFSKIDSRDKENEQSEVRLQKKNLPKHFEDKITKLMKSIQLNIGSIDVLETKEGELYFLEVNPVGQISGYSYRANLNFEKKIVEKMIILDNEIKEKRRG